MEQSNGQLFVYGSLRSGFHHPAYAYISRYFTLLSDARVKGNLYDMGEFPAAVPTTEEHYIIGELYRISRPDEWSWAMGQLDDYEGLHTENNEPALYKREQVPVYLKNGETTTAWIYWFNGPITGENRISSGDVLEYLQQKKQA
ncbi:MAG: gamma-glutamylcyclotransferase [Bacteroidota bacterium]|nr:gamma-glutamylcyclotransferase [Bacteroidota bacterium]